MVKAQLIRKGQIFMFDDKDPTGRVKAHNYLILSNPNKYTNTILAYTITSCRNGNWKDVIPLECINDMKSYISTKTLYQFDIDEINIGRYHGCIDDETVDKIANFAMVKSGMITDEFQINEIVNSMDGLLSDITRTVGGMQLKPKKEDAVKTEEKPPITKTEFKEKEKLTSLPRFIRNWRLKDLLTVSYYFDNRKFAEIKEMCKIGNDRSVYNKKATVDKEISKRVPSKFSEKCYKYSSQPHFWEEGDLNRYYYLYTSDRDSLKDELNTNISKIIQTFSSVCKIMETKGL